MTTDMPASGLLRDRKVMVTGASGFLGSHLCRRLRNEGAEIYAISRSAREDAGERFRWLQGDLSDTSMIRRMLLEVKPDVIFHLSGLATGACGLELVLPTLHTLLVSTVNLLTVAAEIGSVRVVLAGSLTEPIADHAEPTPGSPYAAAKWASSVYGRMFFQLYKTPVVIVRPFMTYGPGQSIEKLIPYVTLSALRGEPPKLSSSQWKADWIYVDDVVAGFLAAGSTPSIDGLTIDLGSGELTTAAAVVQEIIDLTGHTVKPIFGAHPDRPFEQIRVADIKQTYATLGWQPTVSLTEGLERTISWLRERVKEDPV